MIFVYDFLLYGNTVALHTTISTKR